MTSKYQIIIIGTKNILIANILEVLFHHISELGLKRESFLVIEERNFNEDYKSNAPSFCLYFGNDNGIFGNLDILKKLINDASFILPVVENLRSFSKSIPKELRNVNGFELSTVNEIEKLVSCVLEGLSLLRLSRRLFISYKRDESSAVAIQLFEQFEKYGFDVFLDTHSIRPGEIFQEELWHRMADTDVVVLLNTPGFLNSHWTSQELAKANAMSIGVFQLIWPNHTLEREAKISSPFQLKTKDFAHNIFDNSKGYLIDSVTVNIASQVESLRARSLAARQDNLITEFISSARKVGKKADLQPEKFIIVSKSGGKKLIIIPTIGVPQAFTYHQSEEMVSRIKSTNVVDAYLLYDHRNIREKWLKHLAWLDGYLPIKTIKIVDVEEWLETI